MIVGQQDVGADQKAGSCPCPMLSLIIQAIGLNATDRRAMGDQCLEEGGGQGVVAADLHLEPGAVNATDQGAPAHQHPARIGNRTVPPDIGKRPRADAGNDEIR